MLELKVEFDIRWWFIVGAGTRHPTLKVVEIRVGSKLRQAVIKCYNRVCLLKKFFKSKEKMTTGGTIKLVLKYTAALFSFDTALYQYSV